VEMRTLLAITAFLGSHCTLAQYVPRTTTASITHFVAPMEKEILSIIGKTPFSATMV
jgi:hypothetical protein